MVIMWLSLSELPGLGMQRRAAKTAPHLTIRNYLGVSP
jgi:hypothetical protein